MTNSISVQSANHVRYLQGNEVQTLQQDKAQLNVGSKSYQVKWDNGHSPQLSQASGLRSMFNKANPQELSQLAGELKQAGRKADPKISQAHHDFVGFHLTNKLAAMKAANSSPRLNNMSQDAFNDLVGKIGDNRSGPPIPKQLHRFWTGGPLSDDAMHLIKETQKKANQHGYQQTIWTSTRFNAEHLAASGKPGLSQQLQELAKLGCQIKDFEASHDSEMGEHAAALTETLNFAIDERRGDPKNWDPIKNLSDLARLSYLDKHGGFHMDIDIGLGTMDLSREYHHQDPAGQIPLMGAFLRDENSGETIVGHYHAVHNASPRDITDVGQDSAKAICDQAENAGEMFNALIASQPNSGNVRAALQQLVQRNQAANMAVTGMVVTPNLIHGDPMQQDPLNTLLSVPPYVLDLETLTPESSR